MKLSEAMKDKMLLSFEVFLQKNTGHLLQGY